MTLKLYSCEDDPTIAEMIAKAKAVRTAEIINYLTQLGMECAGGAGDQRNPKTGKFYGSMYFNVATMVLNKFPLR